MVHEVAHGTVAHRLGDDTAKQLGRLTLNPLKHLDFFGSIFLPLFLVLSQSPVIFGWAKPVPYNPENLKNPKIGAAMIGIAGPLSNFALAVIFGILIRILAGVTEFFPDQTILLLMSFFNIIVIVNLVLGVFNLVPIPPLDGSKVLFTLLPRRHYQWERFLEIYGMWILLIFILFGFNLILPIIAGLYSLIVGV